MIKDNLRALMAERGVTLEALATRLQDADTPISYSSLSSYYHGQRDPGIGNALAMANALNCNIDELVRGRAS